MRKVSEYIQRVQNLYSKGTPSDDTRLRSRHIFSKLSTVRNRLLIQKSNKKQKISVWSYQELPCVELIQAPLHECPDIPTGSCRILRSKYRLPKFMSNLDSDLIKSVNTIDGSTNFSSGNFETVKYQKGNKYTSKDSLWYIRNGYLYITNNKLLEVVSVIGLFENLEEVWKFKSYCGSCEDCEDVNDICQSYLDKDFPIDGDLEEPLIEIASQELIQMFNSMREDQSNNSVDNLQQETK